MKRKTSKLLSLLLAAALLFPIGAPAALAAGTDDAVHLRTAGDLAELSRNCALDSWSQGKTVYLEADIDLTGVDFAPIPTFGGTFEGQGHIISGLSLTGSGNARGLFRYIQPDGAVRDLHVSGSIAPSGRENTLGGLAGENRGTITNCSFSGTVSGADSVGGLVGVNEAQGRLINCSFSGSVTGEHYVGGIAGQNYGSIVQCGNSGSINTTEVDAELNLDNLNQERLNAAENVPVCTDIGGIAGFSSGILQSCVNTGAVGYAHVGYNIGGIVGRQSGNLNGCANSGTVLGRKDVGGVAGQLEPEVRLLYEEGKLGQLMDELDTLSSLIRRTGEDIQDSSDELSKRMRDLQDQAEDVRDAVDDLAAWAGDLADEAAGVIGDLSDRISRLIEKLLSILEDAVGAADLSDRISRLIEKLLSILEDAVGAADLAEKLAGRLEEAARQAEEAGKLSPDEAEQLLKAAEALRAAARDVREAAERLEAAEERLRNALGDREQTAAALEEAADAAGRLMEALSRMGDAAAQAAGSWGGGGAGMAQEDLAALRAALAAVSASLEKVESIVYDEENYAMAVKKGENADVLAAINEVLAEMEKNGEIDAMGTHDELLKNNETYRDLYYTQHRGGEENGEN